MGIFNNIRNLGTGYISSACVLTAFAYPHSQVGLASFALAALALCLSKRGYNRPFVAGAALGTLRACYVFSSHLAIQPPDILAITTMPAAPYLTPATHQQKIIKPVIKVGKIKQTLGIQR